MDLKSGYPYWAIRNGLMRVFPRIDQEWRGDVAVIGGGITGALVANELATAGHGVVVLEQRDIGWGSTAASTALLQYEIDTHLIDLCKRYGEADGVLAYRACIEGLDIFERLASTLGNVDFKTQQSLYLASAPRHVATLQEEARLRTRHGIAAQWLDAEEVRARYRIDAAGAILSEKAARVDPYRMTYRLLARLARQGVDVFDRTQIVRIEPLRGRVRLVTANGPVVEARHVVVAAGYAAQSWLPGGLAKNRSSYAFITDPLDPALLGELDRTLVWESARPYLYLRSTRDHRLLVGGADDAVDVPARRDARVDKKARVLLKQLSSRAPHLTVEPAFAWGGTFAETRDGLPWFGPHPRWGGRVHFAMAYGGNGITYSAIGATLLRATIERRRHPLSRLFGFDRLRRM
ncbi:NAD(P)/FAD-dependent oxidoreductase [Lysobacter auxotrophicus]|uniref:FAD-binding oxidoreductase n=1 Tax=Lysobacter auxotrophicus TaxID=2992573 RepID=A0ABN6UFV4_9GAMM|nr:FAD-dependent oxidoreductase [Lysobacter auxotrophicus]BDU15167.1 FAD-binding oxidoreductase [Lysobacter auxotrophicus]